MNSLSILSNLVDLMEHHLCELQDDIIDEVETKKGKEQFKKSNKHLFDLLEEMEKELETINGLD